MTLRRETREQVGLKPPTNRRHDVALKGVAIHYPGADTRIRDMNHAQHQQLVRGWQSMHMSNGSNDIEYGSLICPCGIWMEARTEWDKPLVRVGSNSTAAANRDYTSVQLMLGNREAITRQEVAWLGEAVAWLRGQGWGPAVVGHRDLSQTACPGDSIYAALPQIRQAADQQQEPAEEIDMPMVFFTKGSTRYVASLVAQTYRGIPSNAVEMAIKDELRASKVPFREAGKVDDTRPFGVRIGA